MHTTSKLFHKDAGRQSPGTFCMHDTHCIWVESVHMRDAVPGGNARSGAAGGEGLEG